MRLGVIGCGNMGGGMAAYLLESGQDVRCYDPDPDVLAGMKTLGAIGVASAFDLAASCDVIILSLPSAAVVRAVMAEIAPRLQPNSVVLDSSTSEPETSKAMAVLGDGFRAIARIWTEGSTDIPDRADFNEITKYDGKGAKV